MALRTKSLIKNFCSTKINGLKSGEYDIEQVNPNSYEEFYIMLKPKSGIYRDQIQILHMKTTYGSDQKYQYPINPPLVKFITNVFHTNISKSGSICLDILKDQEKWMPTYDFEQVILNIMLLYQEPNTSSPFNVDASKAYNDCRKKFRNEFKKGMVIDEEEKLKEECFSSYKVKADNYANKNKLSKFIKYFPIIEGKFNLERETEIKNMYDTLNKKKSNTTKEKKSKVKRWERHQK